MKRPAFQFYPADWRSNAKLRRCSEAARGAWVDVLCLMHDSDEYGVIRWPLAEIARAAGVSVRLLRELIEKGVLKGSDTESPAFSFTPRHAGKDGEPVELIPAATGPCWYCSRFVRDEHIRQKRGSNSQFTAENQPPKPKPKSTPKHPFGDGPSSASSSSSPSESKGPRRPTLDQAIAAASQIGINPDIARCWWETREASDWIRATATGNTPVGSNWQADLKQAAPWAAERLSKQKRPAAGGNFSADQVGI